MFNFFKKDKEISEKDLVFLERVVKALPSKYSYLKDQVNRDFILYKKNNKLSGKGTYTLVLNAALEVKYSNKSLPQFFIIQDIYIWNRSDNAFSRVELGILEGMLAGFKLEEDVSSLDLNKIDTSRVKEKNFNNEDVSFVKRILDITNPDDFQQFDIGSSFKIEESNGDFYTIKDFKDGNYLAIDDKGAVYLMLHDPYLIEKIFDRKEEFIDALKRGRFDVDIFYNEWMSKY